MRFAEFYHLSTGYIEGTIPPRFSPDHVKPIPACGDRSVLILDARNRMEVSAFAAEKECKRRGYVGFTINEGDSFTRSRLVRPYQGV